MQRSSAQLWGKQGARGALIAGIAAVACCLPAPASGRPRQPSAGGGGVAARPSTARPRWWTPAPPSRSASWWTAAGPCTRWARSPRSSHGSTTYSQEQRVQLQRDRPVRGHLVGPEVNGTVDTIAFDASNCSTAYLGGHFTSVGGPRPRTSPRSTRPPARWSRLQGQRQRRGGDPRGGERAPAGRRCLQGHQRQHHGPVLRQPEPGHRPGRRVRAPEHLRALRLPRGETATRPRSTTSRSATAARWTWSKATSPRWAARAGSRSSCWT